MIAKNKLISIIGFLIIATLGWKFIPTYSLWDDEANTALFAQTVKQTGDTDARYGQNLIAYRNGAELNQDLKARYVSPLQYYFAAPFVQEKSPISARLPFFALFLITFVGILIRLNQLKVQTRTLVAFLAFSFGLTSFLLFGLQARYYALTLFFSAILADLYWFSKAPFSKSKTALFAITAGLLFISNYLVGIAVLGSLAIHACFFRRTFLKQSFANLLIFIPLYLSISLPVFLIWNPLTKNVAGFHNTVLDRFNLFYRNLRDFNGGMFGSLLLLIAGLFILKNAETKNRFRQYGLIFVSYLILISVFSPQPVRATGMADIRYLYPLMLLSITWSIDFWNSFSSRKTVFAIGVLIFSFCSFPYEGKFRFPLFELIGELRSPAHDPYQAGAELLKRQGSSDSTVLSSIDYAAYPLMFLAPEYHYVGQTQNDLAQDPDYLISFCDDSVVNRTHSPAQYQLVDEVQSVCKETFRPEIFLRNFGRREVLGTIKLFKKEQK